MQQQRSLCLCLSNTSAGGRPITTSPKRVPHNCQVGANCALLIVAFQFAQFQDGTWKDSIVISKRVGKCKEKFSAVFCLFSPNRLTESYCDRREDQSKNNFLTTLQKTGIKNEGKIQAHDDVLRQKRLFEKLLQLLSLYELVISRYTRRSLHL